MSVEIVDPNQFDFDEFHKLLKNAFQERDSSNSSISVPSAKELSYKYLHSPHPSKIAVVRSSGNLVAVNGLLPIEITRSDLPTGKSLSWMSCDTATHNDFRGQGLFKKCISELEKEIPNGSLFFGFPNTNSMPGFQKLGWQIFREYQLWVSPSFFNLQKSAEINEVPISEISTSNTSGIGIKKNNHYLDWRYYSDKNFYRAFKVSSQNVDFSAITRVMTLNGIKFTLILELITHDDNLSQEVLRSLSILAKKLKTSGALITNKDSDYAKYLKGGFVKIPSRLINRRIFLSGKFLDDSENSKLNPKNWKISLGDFDAL